MTFPAAAGPAPAVPLPVVSIDVRYHEQSLKVTWHHDEGFDYPPYFVDPAMLGRFGEKVRSKLAPLVAVAREGTYAFGPALSDLAKAGRDLYEALFVEATGREEIANEVREDLEARTSPCRILVKVDRRIHIPWGLLYGGPRAGISSSGKVEDFGEFFCLKHNLSVVHNRVQPRVEPRGREAFQLLPVLNRGSFELARGALAPGEQQIVDEVLRRDGEPAYASAEFKSRWRITYASVGLIYFYCHANGTSLALAADDLVDIDTLRLLGNESRVGRERICLFFLNGCATAVGNSAGGFLEAASHPGFCGFIGTETQVPDVFALRFGTAFLHIFLDSGRPVWEVMESLRRQHFPLSLLYGLYGHPLVRVDSRVGPFALPSPLLGNFSQGVVGTKDMEGAQ